MRKPKCEPIIKQKNRFAVLADTDSDDDLPDYAPLSPSFGAESGTPEPFTSENVEVEEVSVAEVEPAFRVWKNDVTRFSSDTNNIFSSPFSRKGRTKREDDGWTSIESGPSSGPSLGPSSGLGMQGLGMQGLGLQVPVNSKDCAEFPSMLNRGDMIDEKERADAKAWAAIINVSLDKARTGQRRNLSFFRRTVVLDEKF